MSQYRTGTVSVTNSSAIITGSGTSWLTYAHVGDSFKIKSENAVYSIASVDSDTQVTLTTNYVGVTDSGLEYQIVVDFTPSLELPEIWAGDIDWPYHLTVGLRRIDTLFAGLVNTTKMPCRAASIADVAATYSSTAMTLTANANGAITIDGISLVANDRVLVKDQSDATENGIYFVSVVGTAGTPFVLTRATDFDTTAEVTSGVFVFIEEGTVNADTGWMLTTNNPITLDTTSLTFTIFSKAGTLAAPMTTATDPALNAAVTTAIVDSYAGVVITLTTTGNNQTLQSPTDIRAGKTFTVVNNDTSTNNVSAIANSVTFTVTPGEAQTFIWDGGAWGPIDIGITSIPVIVPQGGTGTSTLTDHGVLVGSGTDAITALTVGASGTILAGTTGADPVFTATPSGLTSIGVTTVNATTVNATTFDTNVAAAGVTLNGTTLAADGSDSNIDISITPKGTGEVNITKVDIDAGAIDGTTIGANSPAAITGTTITANTTAYIGDTANAKVTQGLTINQGANDDEILDLKSSDVGHSVTDNFEADTYGAFAKTAATTGGLTITGITDADAEGALTLRGIVGASDPTDTNAPVVITGAKLSTNTYGALAAAEEVLQIKNHTTNLVTVLGSGKVGIGVTNPSELLSLKTVTNGLNIKMREYGFLGISGSGQIPTLGLNIRVDSTGTSDTPLVANTHATAGYAGIQFYGHTSGIRFFTKSGSVSSGDSITVPKMVLDGSGNVGIMTTAPDKALEINSATGACLRLTYNDSNGSAANYTDFSVSSSGDLTITPSGGDITLAGSLTMPDAGKITWDIAPASDHTCSGNVFSATAGEALVFGDVCYLKSDGKYWKIDADAIATMPVTVFATASINADAAGVFLNDGWARDDSWSWTIGGLVYASTTGGGLTQTAPSGEFDVVQIVGHAETATVIKFRPEWSTLEVGLDILDVGTATPTTITMAELSAQPKVFLADHSSNQTFNLAAPAASDAGKQFWLVKDGASAGTLILDLPDGVSCDGGTAGGTVTADASARASILIVIVSTTQVEILSAKGTWTIS